MSRWVVAFASCTVLALGLGACGSDKKDPGFQSGVDGNTMLGNLSSEQQVTLCTSQAAYVKAHVDTTSLMRFVCGFTPDVLLAPSDAACESAIDACIKVLSVKVDVTVTNPTALATVCSTVPISQCQGTVADYENCVNSISNVQLTLGTDFSCGKRATYQSNPTLGVNACAAVGPSCTAATQPAQIR